MRGTVGGNRNVHRGGPLVAAEPLFGQQSGRGSVGTQYLDHVSVSGHGDKRKQHLWAQPISGKIHSLVRDEQRNDFSGYWLTHRAGRVTVRETDRWSRNSRSADHLPLCWQSRGSSGRVGPLRWTFRFPPIRRPHRCSPGQIVLRPPARFFEQDPVPTTSVLAKVARVQNRPVDVRLCGSINHAVDPVLFQQSFDERLIGDVAMDESVLSMTIEILRIRGIAGIFERVEIYDLMAVLDHQPSNEMRADESRSSRYKNIHVCISVRLIDRFAIGWIVLSLAAPHGLL